MTFACLWEEGGEIFGCLWGEGGVTFMGGMGLLSVRGDARALSVSFELFGGRGE